MASILGQVSLSNVNDGKRRNVCLCPVALALQSTFPGCDIEVLGTDAFIDFKIYALDNYIRAKILEFDSTGWMEPFPFAVTEDYIIIGEPECFLRLSM